MTETNLFVSLVLTFLEGPMMDSKFSQYYSQNFPFELTFSDVDKQLYFMQK